MFTGIIKKVEKIISVTSKNQSLFIEISLPKGWKLKEGESICINGICSTVRDITKNSFEVEYMPETISKTTAGSWSLTSFVNLEQSLTLADFVDGHLVLGHVDTTAKIIDIQEKGNSKIFTVAPPEECIKYIAPKGSIALDGVSLTVVDTKPDWFTVSLVSYTLSHTTFGHKKVGDLINLETDMIAKYIHNILTHDYEKRRT